MQYKKFEPLTPTQALLMYALLIELGGYRRSQSSASALSTDLLEFINLTTKDTRIEFRFQGNLGFGGKLYGNNNGWYVGCYPDHRTPERDALIDAMNERINQILTP